MIMEKDSEKLLEFIKSRKSVRNFVFSKIKKEIIEEILDCGRWAPSGLNNQPWKVFVITYPSVKTLVAECTKYGGIIESAFTSLVIFYDKEKGYNRVKDIQACGAFMENVLLAIHAFNYGAVWLGEILNQKEEVNKIFKLSPAKFELMGVIAIGEIDEAKEKKGEKIRERRPLEDFVEWL